MERPLISNLLMEIVAIQCVVVQIITVELFLQMDEFIISVYFNCSMVTE